MSDLVQRLRKGCPIETADGTVVGRTKPNPYEFEAADRIESLETERNDLAAEVCEYEMKVDWLDRRIESLEAVAVQMFRAIESLPDDALGVVPERHDCPAYPVKAELLHNCVGPIRHLIVGEQQ